MAVDISQRTNQIRHAVYGKDVRENLAGGIEDIANDVNNFEGNINNQWSVYKQNMDANESNRGTNENNRISNEIIRQTNEGIRQTVYNDFRDFVNIAQQINRVPYLFDGGSFGDPGNWILSMDGDSF
ncbi:hypothetical protein [Clostridium sp. BJN0013]|uniref:hypothetical protein n=1 Tax=Clostridium sp. BJN0013 TaxID=3236840 RepID=UPI0034C67A6B